MQFRTLCVVVCLLLGSLGAIAKAADYQLTVTKVVEWNGVEAPVLPDTIDFEICVSPADPSCQTFTYPNSLVKSWVVSCPDDEFPCDYVISEPNLGPEWDYLVGLPGDDPLSPDEVFVDNTVTVSGDTNIVVRNSRLLNYAFVAIGNQILRVDLANLVAGGEPVLPDPEDQFAPYDTLILYEAADTVFDGVTMAGDGNLYICGKNPTNGFVIRLMDPLDALPSEDPQLVFQYSATEFDPACGTVDPFGGLVVANAYGGVLKFYDTPPPSNGPGAPEVTYEKVEGGGIAGMCVFRYTDGINSMADAGLCWPDLSAGPFPGTLLGLTIPDSRDALVGLPSDVAYFYDNDLLVRTELALDGGGGSPGQQKKQPTAEGALLRVFWPDFDPEFDDFGYDGGFCDVVDGCDPADCTQQNFKPLVSGLEPAGEVTVSGNRIFVTNGKELRVVVPPASPAEDCVDPVATLDPDPYASVSGNERIQVAAGDLDGRVYFGTRGSNSAKLYLADGLTTSQVKAFSKNDYAAGIDGLAVTLSRRPADLAELLQTQDPEVEFPATLDREEIELDGMKFYLTAECDFGATVTEVPVLQTVAQRLIEDIPDNTDPNDPLANLGNVAIPNTPPGLEGWQALVETQGCNVTDVPGVEQDLLLYEFWYSILSSNRRLTRHDSTCSADAIDGEDPPECSSQFEAVLANSLFDPGVVFPDPIGGGGSKRSRRQVVGAALDPTRAAVFFGYLSPLFTCLDPTGELCDVYTVTSTPATTVPIKFKLEDTSGEPLIGAVALATVARVANVPPTDPTYPGNPENSSCPFPEFMQIEPNGAGYLGGELGLSPLFEGNQGNGNYSFNQLVQCTGQDPDVTSDDWCTGDYRITATFFSDNLAEQETLLRVTGCP